MSSDLNHEHGASHTGDGTPLTIRESNLSLIAIVLQAAAVNICIQPIAVDTVGTAYIFALLWKLVPLLLCSVWMARNLRYEENSARYKKNVQIELLYCAIQACVAVAAIYSDFLLFGALGLLALCLAYILVINPKYMKRTLVKTKAQV